MDRRQQKTRAAIFAAFSALLSEKAYSKITVQEIIDRANVGRTTFYAHFETKDELLHALCGELFGHIVASALDCTHTHGLCSDGSAPRSVFCHLLQHIQGNDAGVLDLLACENNELFLRYFKNSLNNLVRTQVVGRSTAGQDAAGQGAAGHGANADIPDDFLVNHVSGSFVEMVLWWIRGGMTQTPAQLDRYFRAVIEPIL